MSKQEKDSIMMTAGEENSTVNERMDAKCSRTRGCFVPNDCPEIL